MLRPRTVKESFLFGCGDGEAPDEHFMNLVARSIIFRLETAKKMKSSGAGVTFVSFERLISDPEYMTYLAAMISQNPSRIRASDFSRSVENNKGLIEGYKDLVDKNLLFAIRLQLSELLDG